MSDQLLGRSRDDIFILRRGISVDWQQSMYCSCYNRDSGQPNYNCNVCHGSGRIYLTAQEIKVLITNVKQDKAYSIVGVWELGTCRCTVPASVNIGNLDRVIFKNMMLTFTETPVRRQNVNLGTKDILRFFAIENIKEVRKVGATYVQGTDYQLSADSNYSYIEWLTANKPADNSQYSILYEHRPEFLAWDVPQIRSDSDDYQLPKFAILRRRDLVTAQKTL